MRSNCVIRELDNIRVQQQDRHCSCGWEFYNYVNFVSVKDMKCQNVILSDFSMYVSKAVKRPKKYRCRSAASYLRHILDLNILRSLFAQRENSFFLWNLKTEHVSQETTSHTAPIFFPAAQIQCLQFKLKSCLHAKPSLRVESISQMLSLSSRQPRFSVYSSALHNKLGLTLSLTVTCFGLD